MARLMTLPAMQPTGRNEQTVTLLDLKLMSQQNIQTSRNFTCEAQIKQINEERGWYYVVCSKCSNKLYPQQNDGKVIFVCKDDDNITPNFRHNRKCTTGSADTVFFNKSMQAILDMSCKDMVTKHAHPTNPKKVPHLIRSIIDTPRQLHLTLKNDGQIGVNDVSNLPSTAETQSTGKVPATSTFTPTTPIPKPGTSKRQLTKTQGDDKKMKLA